MAEKRDDAPDKRRPPETRIPAPATTKRADVPHLKSVATLVRPGLDRPTQGQT